MIIEGNSGVCVHYAGAAKPNVGAGAVREYKLAKLPKLVVEGALVDGFSVKGFPVPQNAAITAFLGSDLAVLIGKWPEAERARAVHNLIAFIEEAKPRIYGANRGIQATITDETESMGDLNQVKIGFDTRRVFAPGLRPQELVELGVDLELSSSGSHYGRVDVLLRGIAWLWYANYDIKLPAKDLEAILRFQGA